MTQTLWNQLNDQQAEVISGGRVITRTLVEEDTIVYNPDDTFSVFNLSNYRGVPNPRSGFTFTSGYAEYNGLDGDSGYWDYASITLTKQTGPKQ